MYVKLHSDYADDPLAREAAAIIKSCVHCGFCNATCPTYQELFDERDGPRGRVYLVRALLENGEAGDASSSSKRRSARSWTGSSAAPPDEYSPTRAVSRRCWESEGLSAGCCRRVSGARCRRGRRFRRWTPGNQKPSAR